MFLGSGGGRPGQLCLLISSPLDGDRKDLEAVVAELSRWTA